MRQIAIALGYSHLDFITLANLMEEYTVPARFCAMGVYDGREEPYSGHEGQAVAEEMVVRMAHKYNAPLCIGVVAIRFVPICASFRPASMDIAVIMERGNLKKPFPLTPQTTRNASLSTVPKYRRPNEAHYAREAGRTLLEAIKQRSKALHLV